MIAVCLLTCGRGPLTGRTIGSFDSWNYVRKDLFRIHADGGCEQPAILYHGWPCIDRPPSRVPQMHSFRKLIEEAAVRGAEFVMWLENDWESVGPLPKIEFLREHAKAGIKTWRLFGEFKMREPGPRARAGEHEIGSKNKIDWKPGPAGWETGAAHWAAGGSIATLACLEAQIYRPRMKDVITAEPRLPSMRVRENLMFHIGEKTTEGMYG